MTVFSLSCLLKSFGALKALKLGIDGFELVAQLMEHADSVANSTESIEQLNLIDTTVIGWLMDNTDAKMYPTDFGVAIGWNGYHVLNFGDDDNIEWYSKNQLDDLEEGEKVEAEGYENSLQLLDEYVSLLEEYFNTELVSGNLRESLLKTDST